MLMYIYIGLMQDRLVSLFHLIITTFHNTLPLPLTLWLSAVRPVIVETLLQIRLSESPSEGMDSGQVKRYEMMVIQVVEMGETANVKLKTLGNEKEEVHIREIYALINLAIQKLQ